MGQDQGHSHDHSPEKPGSGGGHEGHEHGAELRSTPARRLAIALGLTLSFMAVEVVAGVLTHSLALLSDAVHMLTDAGALMLALWAQRVARRARTARRTYGFRRAEILAACANGVALAVSSVWIGVEALRRWSQPPEVRGVGMLAVAAVGLGVNLVSAWVLSRGEGHNANTRAAMAHVLADAAGSVAAMLAGVLVIALRWNRADPLISLVISALILWAAWKLVRDAIDVLMEGAPLDLDLTKVEQAIRSQDGVADLHDLHAWTVADGFAVVTVHVVLRGDHHGVSVAASVASLLREKFKIEHATVQPEAPREAPVVPADRLVRREKTPAKDDGNES